MDLTCFSDRYRVRHLNCEDTARILALCERNPLYYRYFPPFVTERSVIADMEALPPGKGSSDKHYVGYFDGEDLIAVLDLVMAFPDEETAYIGFFMTDASVQNAGIGSRIIGDLCGHLAGMGMKKVRLGWAAGNPQAEHFWHKNGFLETGTVRQTGRCRIIVAQRELQASPGGIPGVPDTVPAPEKDGGRNQ